MYRVCFRFKFFRLTMQILYLLAYMTSLWEVVKMSDMFNYQNVVGAFLMTSYLDGYF